MTPGVSNYFSREEGAGERFQAANREVAEKAKHSSPSSQLEDVNAVKMPELSVGFYLMQGRDGTLNWTKLGVFLAKEVLSKKKFLAGLSETPVR
jgi:hypothetical protein